MHIDQRWVFRICIRNKARYCRWYKFPPHTPPRTGHHKHFIPVGGKVEPHTLPRPVFSLFIFSLSFSTYKQSYYLYAESREMMNQALPYLSSVQFYDCESTLYWREKKDLSTIQSSDSLSNDFAAKKARTVPKFLIPFLYLTKGNHQRCYFAPRVLLGAFFQPTLSPEIDQHALIFVLFTYFS